MGPGGSGLALLPGVWLRSGKSRRAVFSSPGRAGILGASLVARQGWDRVRVSVQRPAAPGPMWGVRSTDHPHASPRKRSAFRQRRSTLLFPFVCLLVVEFAEPTGLSTQGQPSSPIQHINRSLDVRDDPGPLGSSPPFILSWDRPVRRLCLPVGLCWGGRGCCLSGD